MELLWNLVPLLLLFSVTQIEGRQGNSTFYTGYSCSETTKCPENAGFCNDENKCECDIGYRPTKIGEKTVCGVTQCYNGQPCWDDYGKSSECIQYHNDEGGYTHRCGCWVGLGYSRTHRECKPRKLQNSKMEILYNRSKFGEECSSDSNCTIDIFFDGYYGTYCHQETGKCKCPLGLGPNTEYNCKTSNCIGRYACENSDPNMVCVSLPYNYGPVCKCRDGYVPDNDHLGRKCIIKSCKMSDDCPSKFSCIDGKCQKSEKTKKNSSNFLFLSLSVFIVSAVFGYFSVL